MLDFIDYLLVERYDRVRNKAGKEASKEAGANRRVHQEDLCQAFGVAALIAERCEKFLRIFRKD